MPNHIEDIRLALASGPLSSRKLQEKLEVSQPTLSRALASMGSEVLKIGVARSIQYALLDVYRGVFPMPIYWVNSQGLIQEAGQLYPARPSGYVWQPYSGTAQFFDGLPWWLSDMRPQGYLGRAFARKYGEALGFGSHVHYWSDDQVLAALAQYGSDSVGQWVVGTAMRTQVLNQPKSEPIDYASKVSAYTQLAQAAASGDLVGSSAGGEQPKFTAYAQIHPEEPACHVIVKFSQPEANAITERWRDILLAEHHALAALNEVGIVATASQVIDTATQRFLEVPRFDRVGASGRKSLVSLAALDAEFVGSDHSLGWPAMVQKLIQAKQVQAPALNAVAVLWAFGVLIGNTDMHAGNLSFIADEACLFDVAPAYDMAPMAFAPHVSGAVSNSIPSVVSLPPLVQRKHWDLALQASELYLQHIEQDGRFSTNFVPCLQATRAHTMGLRVIVSKLG